MTQYGLTAYDQQVYAAFAVAAANGVDPLTYITSQGLTFPSSQTSPNPFPAGTTNINVLLYLQKAGLDPTTAAVQQEYSLSAQDIADYNIILQVQAQYPPPNTPDFTDPTVQAQYDLVSTPISSETAPPLAQRQMHS